jgi:hypothetical protein
MRGSRLRFPCALLALALLLRVQPAAAALTAQGLVFADENGNGLRDAAERGLAGVAVSNGREVTRSDAAGRWRLPADDDAVFFVIKPTGWMTPVDGDGLPRFYHLHKPAGSPPSRYPGVAPTGPLPASLDFALTARAEPARFTALLFGDTQVRNQKEIDYLAHDVIEELIGSRAAFGVTLGDVLFDDLSHFETLSATVGLIGIPWHNVLGNHDMNYDAADDRHSDESFERAFGPAYYAFDYGPAHFIVLDDVVWQGQAADADDYAGGNYIGGLGADQLEFLRQDLALVPAEKLVVLFMHIPFVAEWIEADREALYRLLEPRAHALSVSAHFHYHEHRFLDAEDGWRGAAPHHHLINATTCGSWWSGAPDEAGIPHTTMRDGAPNGYTLLTVDGADYRLDFKAARRPASEQMSLWAPETVGQGEAGDAELLVNVYNGSPRTRVEFRLGEGEWLPMERVVREDPYYAAMKALEAGDTPPPGRKLPKAGKSPHLWAAPLPVAPPRGVHGIEVRATDHWGRVVTGRRVIRIE